MRLRRQIAAIVFPTALWCQQPAPSPSPISDTFRSFSHYGRWLIASLLASYMRLLGMTPPSALPRPGG